MLFDNQHRMAEDECYKDAQKQQYALQKADQEAGGLRGFLSSVSKIKMTLWRDNSNDYINNTGKLDYSKIK